MTEFDYQWKNLPSKSIEYNHDRIEEFKKLTNLNVSGLHCLDAGCGNGRYTYAMIKLGAIVDSFDVSWEAIRKCQEINPYAFTNDIMLLKPNPLYDFVLCWGVLHHTRNPREAFKKIASQVRLKGILHIMIYHEDKQKKYENGRKIWRSLSEKEKIKYCKAKAEKLGGTIHGCYNAFNPIYNFSYHEDEIKQWFEEEGFDDIKLIKKYNINMQGTRENINADI